MVFLTYFVIPLSLRIATSLSVVLTVFHLIVATSVSHRTPGEVLARQVSMWAIIMRVDSVDWPVYT